MIHGADQFAEWRDLGVNEIDLRQAIRLSV
jgi:hypothetical protein